RESFLPFIAPTDTAHLDCEMLRRHWYRVIETWGDYSNIASKTGQTPNVCPVTVEAWRSGKMLLHFPDWVEKEQFRLEWQNQYPSLVDFCELAEDGCNLKIKQEKEPNRLEDVASLCEKMLEANLVVSEEPTWFLVRQSDPHLVWPRSVYC